MPIVDPSAIDPSLDAALGLQQVNTTDTGHVEIFNTLSSSTRTCPWAFAETALGAPPRIVQVDFDGSVKACRYDSNDMVMVGKL